MKQFYVPKCLLLLLFLSVTTSHLFAQTEGSLTKKANVFISSNNNGYVEYLPPDYTTNPTKRFPLIIMFIGQNSDGPGTEESLERLFPPGGGFIPELVRNELWPDYTTAPDGTIHSFVVLTPQFRSSYDVRQPTPAEVDSLINFAIANYRIDTTRIYLTGNSNGAGVVWDYPGSSSAYADRIAAIVPFSPVVYPTLTKANTIRNSDVAVWGFHNEDDINVPSEFTTDFVKLLNTPTPASPEVRQTIFPGTSHISWYDAYRRTYTENGLDIYEWMLQFTSPASTANAGLDVEFDLPTNSTQLNGSGTGPNGTATSYNWSQVSGPSTANFSSTSVANPTVSGLASGMYIFRVAITDNAGGTATNEVAITVNPQPMRFEGENFTASSGGTSTEPVPGGGNAVNLIDPGEWMEYSVNIPSAGLYTIRYRASSFTEGRFQLSNPAAGTVLDTVTIFRTGGWTTYSTLPTYVELPAGPQTLRITSISAPGYAYNLDWFEVLGAVTATPLPVNFTLFNANCVNGSVNLLWKTASEYNSLKYSVERSINGRDWTSIGTVQAAGQSSSEQSYSFRDVAAVANSQYRIVEIDRDGKKTISSAIRGNCGSRQALMVFPNPVSDKAVLNVTLDQATRVSLSIVDSKGAVVHRETVTLPQGTSQVNLDVNALSKGSYTLHARLGSESKTVKLIKN